MVTLGYYVQKGVISKTVRNRENNINNFREVLRYMFLFEPQRSFRNYIYHCNGEKIYEVIEVIMNSYSVFGFVSESNEINTVAFN